MAEPIDEHGTPPRRLIEAPAAPPPPKPKRNRGKQPSKGDGMNAQSNADMASSGFLIGVLADRGYMTWPKPRVVETANAWTIKKVAGEMDGYKPFVAKAEKRRARNAARLAAAHPETAPAWSPNARKRRFGRPTMEVSNG